MRRHLCFLLLLASVTSAQQKLRSEPQVPPPPRLAGEAPARAVSLRPLAGDLRFTDPAAVVIGSVDVPALAKSEFVRSIVSQMTEVLGEGSYAARAAFDKWIASGTIRRLSVSIAGPDAVVVLVEGRTEPRDLEQWTRDGKMQALRLDANHMMVGNPRALTAALARWKVPTRPETDLIHSGRLLASQSDIWFSAATPAAGGFAVPATAKGIAMGATLRDELRMHAAVDAGSAKAAREFLAQAQDRLTTQTPEGATATSRVEGSVVHVELAFDLQRVKETLAANFSPELRQRVNAFVEEQKPRPKKAMIYGLDDKPREVILSRP